MIAKTLWEAIQKTHETTKGSWENAMLLSLILLRGIQSHKRQEMYLNHYIQRNSGLIYPASPCTVWRLGKETQGITRPIHARLTNAQERYKFTLQRSKLYGSNIYINNDLTPTSKRSQDCCKLPSETPNKEEHLPFGKKVNCILISIFKSISNSRTMSVHLLCWLCM